MKLEQTLAHKKYLFHNANVSIVTEPSFKHSQRIEIQCILQNVLVSFNFVLTKSPNGPFLRTDFGVSCLQEAALSAYQRKKGFECEVLAVEVNSKY